MPTLTRCRTGFNQGELWLDAETVAVVRKSRYLVDNLSIFMNRADVTRDNRPALNSAEG
jgi:hypothetical protein